ncbi:dipeptidase [Paremcibacter congregatus]|uniref:dipeptidase n=1 Tax=Paremcibacter congregatus TaxID=2043170 RepID=UPI003A8CF42A|tara:strand:+ start:1885 stop:3081 length:1197 start_codon:yes stop_codon:yes gene_type:complete
MAALEHKKRGKLMAVLLVIVALALVVYYIALPRYAAHMDAQMNQALESGPYTVSEPAQKLHDSLIVADMHGDFLLWNRDFLEQSDRGLIDLPRLQKGNLSLQAFTIVSKVPKGINIHKNTADSDQITLLAFAQHWPFKALNSLKERALFQSKKLHDYADRSAGQFTLIKTKSDLADFVAARQDGQKITAGFLGIEGAQVLEGDLANVKTMFDAGFRMMAATHFFDTELGGSAHGVSLGGLTDFGAQVFQDMQQRGMLIDIAHASPKLIDDILAQATTPVVSSHTGVRGVCDNQRNLSDAHIKGVAKTGGMIGVGFWDVAVCDPSPKGIVTAIKYVADLVGVDHVGLGSDFDGAITAPFDAGGMALITEELMNVGFAEDDIRKIMGGNALRILGQTLPE